MEASYYNVIAPLKNSVIIYNTRTQGLAELTFEEAAALEKLSEDSAAIPPDLLEDLRASGFVVDSAETEADEMLYRQHQYRNNSHMFELTITPSRVCNFKCDYCYVPERPSSMSEHTQASIVEFIKQHFAKTPFKELRINWYGGEPLLHIDIMESLSAPILSFCDQNNVRYLGHILSNASLADEDMCQRLVKNCRITSVMPTVSGYGDMHDFQRPAKNGQKYFSTIMRNVDHMLDAGIIVHMNYVTNRNNIQECTQLAKELCGKCGLRTRLSKTGAFGKEHIVLRDGKNTPLELFTPEEFGPHYTNFYRTLNTTAHEYRTLLKPIALYCAALVNQSWFIDETGDVTTCMVDMDYPERVLFNVNDWASGNQSVKWERFLAYATLEPIRNPACRTCRVLPLCQGGCYEKYLASGELACHNIKYCIEDIVRDYHAAIMREADIPDAANSVDANSPKAMGS